MPLQPFVKLVQSNTALLMRFSTSPEVVSQWMNGAASMMRREAGTAGNAVPAEAFAELVQGMLKNYAEFMTDLFQNGMAVFTQGQAAWLQQAQDEARDVQANVVAVGARARR